MIDRSYGQFCGIARALDLVGERWALLVVRELLLGPKRFTDLRAGLPGIGTNILAARLKELVRAGVVGRTTLPPPAAATVYELTPYGRELEEIVLALGRWGAKGLGRLDAADAVRSEWLAVALKAYFRPEAAAGLHGVVRLRFPDAAFDLVLADGSLGIGHAAATHADLVLTTTAGTLIDLLAGAPVTTELLESEGDHALLELLPRIFAFPRRGGTAEPHSDGAYDPDDGRRPRAGADA